jgi:hypothetical protein
MNDEILFWIVMLAILGLRALLRRKKPGKAAVSPGPETGQPGARPRIDAPVQAGQYRPPPGTDSATGQPASDIAQALQEIRNAFGLGPATEQRDVEGFGASEEAFEAETPFRDYSGSSEERFESAPMSQIPPSDSETAFEQATAGERSAVFYDDAFERRPASSEVSFRGSWQGHESDFEYHSPLAHDAHVRLKPEQESTPELHRAEPFASRLRRSSDLQRAVLMHEVLSPPVSLRPRSPRRRPS